MAKTPAIVLSSGGLHSLVAAGLAAREHRIALLHLQDGRQSAGHASAAFDKQVAHFQPLKSWSIPVPALRATSLPPENAGVIHSTSSDPYGPLIPLRDLHLLTVAAGFARQLRAERPVEAKERARREAALPERLSVFEAREIKLRAPRARAKLMQRAPVEAGARQRQMRTGRERARHARFVPANPARVNAPTPARVFAWRGARFRGQRLAVDTPPTPTPPEPARAATVYEISGWRRLLLWPAAIAAGELDAVPPARRPRGQRSEGGG